MKFPTFTRKKNVPGTSQDHYSGNRSHVGERLGRVGATYSELKTTLGSLQVSRPEEGKVLSLGLGARVVFPCMKITGLLKS